MIVLDMVNVKERRETMQTTVTGKNQVTIPSEVARKAGIRRGTKLNWSVSKDGKTVRLSVAPTRGELGRRMMGLAREYLKPEDNPIADLITERVRDDADRMRALEER